MGENQIFKMMWAALNICSKLRMVLFVCLFYPWFSLVLFSSSVELLVKKPKETDSLEKGQ